jgi:DNA polymerase III sliding clamp (beta) subunit (PCNA family)
LRFLASDGRRASLVQLDGIGDVPACVMPRTLAREICRLPGDGEAMAELTVATGLIAVRVTGAAVVGNALAGNYPPVERAFPDAGSHKAVIRVSADLLMAAMDRLSVFSEVAVLDIDFDEAVLNCSEENDSGKGAEQLSLEHADGDDRLRLAVNPKYVLTALKAVGQAVVTIGLNGPTGAAVIEAGFHRYLIMPIAVK